MSNIIAVSIERRRGRLSSRSHSSPRFHPPFGDRISITDFQCPLLFHVTLSTRIHILNGISLPIARFMRLTLVTFSRVRGLRRKDLKVWRNTVKRDLYYAQVEFSRRIIVQNIFAKCFQRDQTSPIWGIEAVFAISAIHVIAYHLILVAGPCAFFGWWLGAHPLDLQNASVPATIAGGSLSVLWTISGILTSRELD